MTSGTKAEGRFSKADFAYIAKDNEYQCGMARTMKAMRLLAS
jgi:hypothetical protein